MDILGVQVSINNASHTKKQGTLHIQMKKTFLKTSVPNRYLTLSGNMTENTQKVMAFYNLEFFFHTEKQSQAFKIPGLASEKALHLAKWLFEGFFVFFCFFLQKGRVSEQLF